MDRVKNQTIVHNVDGIVTQRERTLDPWVPKEKPIKIDEEKKEEKKEESKE